MMWMRHRFPYIFVALAGAIVVIVLVASQLTQAPQQAIPVSDGLHRVGSPASSALPQASALSVDPARSSAARPTSSLPSGDSRPAPTPGDGQAPEQSAAERQPLVTLTNKPYLLPHRDLAEAPEVWERFDDGDFGKLPADWIRWDGPANVPNYDAGWSIVPAVVPELGGTLSAVRVYDDPDKESLSWAMYRGTTSRMRDGVLPLTGRSYSEALIHVLPGKYTGRPEWTLQGYFVDGFHYVEAMYQYDGAWFARVWQQDGDNNWTLPINVQLNDIGGRDAEWWGRLGIEIDRDTSTVSLYHNGKCIGTAHASLIDTSTAARTTVRATNTLMQVDDFRIYLWP